MKILKAMENHWSSSSKIKTSCERGGKIERKRMQKSNLAHVGLFDTRGCKNQKMQTVLHENHCFEKSLFRIWRALASLLGPSWRQRGPKGPPENPRAPKRGPRGSWRPPRES